MTSNAYHTPALLAESMEALNIKANGVYVDVTYGGGGHSKALLEMLNDEGRVIAFDQDPDVTPEVIEDDRLIFVPQNFRFLRNHLRALRAIPVDGVLADLGVSSRQFDNPDRGFSIRHDKRLDMRMSKSGKLTAYHVINEYDEGELKRVFRLYGEINRPGRLVHLIIQERDNAPIETTGQLMTLLEPMAPKHKANKFFAQVFQALRIEVNGELDALVALLEQCPEVISKGGRLVVISYHSLEDRLVKNYMKHGHFEGGEPEKDFFGNPQKPFKAMPGKPLTPSEEEIKSNPRSRSAKLRWAERL